MKKGVLRNFTKLTGKLSSRNILGHRLKQDISAFVLPPETVNMAEDLRTNISS